MVKPIKGSRTFQPGLHTNASRPPRAERVAKQLREEISQLMVREMKDPRVRLASVSEVRISSDLKNARVMVSALGEEPERKAVVDALRHAEGYLRAELGHRLENLKTMPRLRFELDESIAYSVHISSMLHAMEKEGAAAADAAAAAESATDTGTDPGAEAGA